MKSVTTEGVLSIINESENLKINEKQLVFHPISF